MRLRTLISIGALALLVGVLGGCHHLDWCRGDGHRHGGWHGDHGGHDRGHGRGGWR